MVEQKIKELQGTKTIIHIDNPAHYDLIMSYITLNKHFAHNEDVENKVFCLWLEDKIHNSWGDIEYAKRKHKECNIITSTELIGYKIYELW